MPHDTTQRGNRRQATVFIREGYEAYLEMMGTGEDDVSLKRGPNCRTYPQSKSGCSSTGKRPFRLYEFLTLGELE
jgi:hypothetical protein